MRRQLSTRLEYFLKTGSRLRHRSFSGKSDTCREEPDRNKTSPPRQEYQCMGKTEREKMRGEDEEGCPNIAQQTNGCCGRKAALGLRHIAGLMPPSPSPFRSRRHVGNPATSPFVKRCTPLNLRSRPLSHQPFESRIFSIESCARCEE
jgi:hypothetical protein